MAHDHGVSSDSKRRVWIALTLTSTFMVAEIVGGLLSGSLALLADAGHMFTDTLALALAAVAFRVSTKPPDARRSYGYARFQILAAFVNGITLVLIVGWILYEAVQRLMQPGPVLGGMMLAVAVAGLVVNIACFYVLHGGDQDNLNIRGAALHVLGDLLGSIGAIVAALVIMQTGWTPIDPLLSVLVALLILNSAWRLVKRSAHILLEGVPEGVDTSDIKARLIDAVPGALDVHHIHVWSLTPDQPMLTMHVKVDSPERSSEVVRQIKDILRRDFKIEHSTIEPETEHCADE